MTNVLTSSNSEFRDGANLNETILTVANVKKYGVFRVASLELTGDTCGTEGQPLYLSQFIMAADNKPHNIVLVANMANYVFCFDAITFKLLWKTYLGLAVKNVKALDDYMINDNWGVISTMRIDLDSGMLYGNALISTDGTMATAEYNLFGIDIATGKEAITRISLENASYQPPNGLPTKYYKTATRKQRSALALANVQGQKLIVLASGSFAESADTNQGWVIAFNITSLKDIYLDCAWCSTNRYYGAGIWMAGQGLYVDEQGYIGGMTGNGAFDGITDFGESFFKLKYTPKTTTAASSLEIAQYMTPYTDTARVGGDPTVACISLLNSKPAAQQAELAKMGNSVNKMAGMSDEVMSNMKMDMPNMPMQAATTNMKSFNDQDLGSGGALYISKNSTGFTKNIVAGAGKDGILYLVDADNMGNPALADFAETTYEAKVAAKFLNKPIWFTFYSPLPPSPDFAGTLDVLPDGKTRHQHSTPAYINVATHGPTIFTWGENSNLRAFRINPDYSCTYMGCSQEVASAECTWSPGGMPGGMLSISANGNKDAILWALIPYGDANTEITQGRFLAYDANNFNQYSDGQGHIDVIWDSQDWGISYMHNKFNRPTIADGQIFVPTYNGTIDVYRLTDASFYPTE